MNDFVQTSPFILVIGLYFSMKVATKTRESSLADFRERYRKSERIQEQHKPDNHDEQNKAILVLRASEMLVKT